jgi:hypothetical protein
LSSSNTREAKVYLECFCERWGALVAPEERVLLDPNGLVSEGEKLTIKALDGFNASAAAKVFEEEIREVVCPINGLDFLMLIDMFQIYALTPLKSIEVLITSSTAHLLAFRENVEISL